MPVTATELVPTIVTGPPRIAVMSGASPPKGTLLNANFSSAAIFAIARWGVVPAPGWRNVSWSGFFRAHSTTSRQVLNGLSARTASASGAGS